jgi:hypothetical protein
VLEEKTLPLITEVKVPENFDSEFTTQQTMDSITGYGPSTMFYILAQVLQLKFRYWWWISHSVPDDEKPRGPMLENCSR